MVPRYTRVSDFPAAAIDRFVASRGDMTPGCCCDWPGRVDNRGVADFRWKHQGRSFQVAAHRLAYILEHGSVDVGMDLFRVCQNKLCVNPDHIVASPRREGSQMRVAQDGLDGPVEIVARPGRFLRADEIPISAVPKFLRRVVFAGADECWLWSGKIKPKGYGVLEIGSRTIRAHRLSYLLFNGELREGLVLRHSCDNKLCVNPAHLLVGSDADNMRDRVERDPGSWKRLRNRFSEEKIAEVRADLERGIGLGKLVHAHGISLGALHKIRDGNL